LQPETSTFAALVGKEGETPLAQRMATSPSCRSQCRHRPAWHQWPQRAAVISSAMQN